MRFSLPILLCAILAELHYSTNGETFPDARSQLGKTLIKRARQIIDKPQGGTEESDIPEEERERVQQLDAAEDIFVGSGNHGANESPGRSETSSSKRNETSEGQENDTREEDDSSTPGDGDEGGEKKDEMEDEGNDDEDDDDDDELEDEEEDEPASVKPQGEGTTGLGPTQSENAERRSFESSGAAFGSGITFKNEQLSDVNFDQSGLGESTIQELLPRNASVDEANGSDDNEVFASGSAAKKSAVKVESGDNDDAKDEDEEEDSGSAEVIRKGIESLSRLLTPVASGYEFELYSAAKEGNKENANKVEFEGESENGVSSSKAHVHVKKCKRVCKEPMTYKQCAVPRCDYKLGTIKDLCIWLCKHQTPVCSQECE